MTLLLTIRKEFQDQKLPVQIFNVMDLEIIFKDYLSKST